MTNSIKRPSLSYVLRLWAEDDGGQWVWRVSMTPISRLEKDDQTLGFATLAAAVVYLQAEMARKTAAGENEP